MLVADSTAGTDAAAKKGCRDRLLVGTTEAVVCRARAASPTASDMDLHAVCAAGNEGIEVKAGLGAGIQFLVGGETGNGLRFGVGPDGEADEGGEDDE